MSEMSKKSRDMIDDLLAAESGLTGWEMDFLESLNTMKYPLSDKQEETLEKIWDRLNK